MVEQVAQGEWRVLALNLKPRDVLLDSVRQ